MDRESILVEHGLSNRQAERLSQDLCHRGLAVECRLSALAGWDVYVYASDRGSLAALGVLGAGAPSYLGATD